MASNEVAEHYNNVRQEGLGIRTQSRIYYQRNFNNWIKSELINESMHLLAENNISKARVLDIACGKGGDLRKWQGRASSMVLADVADISIEQARNRYEENKQRGTCNIPIQFIVADCCNVDIEPLYEDKTPFDVVSCQFALHYSFINEPSARQFLTNCVKNLRPGGLFIGTLPDADRIVWAAREHGGEYKTSVCSVKFENKDELLGTPPLFGTMFHFTLDSQVNCPEFLAYFPLLTHLLSELDMELVFMYRFPEAIEKWRHRGRGLMGKMSALEPYPPAPNVNLAGGEGEYEKAAAFVASLESTDKQTVGTLSKSEWETVCMYLAFAFRKKDPNAQTSTKKHEDSDKGPEEQDVTATDDSNPDSSSVPE